MSIVDDKKYEDFYKVVLNLENIDECKRLFEDIFTIKELNDFVQRLEVAKMLGQNKNYQEISSITGASSATISRVNRCYTYGSGGYKEVIKKLQKEEKNDWFKNDYQRWRNNF